MAYPIDPRREWDYKQVKGLDGGLNFNGPEDQIADNQATVLLNAFVRSGKVMVDTGYDTFGGTVVGQPQKDWTFQRQSGVQTQVLVTTSTVYTWNSTLLRWLLVRGTATTTSTSAYPQGTTVIVVASGVGFSTGDLIAVYLDNGDQLQTTVTVAGTTFTLAAAVPNGRSILNNAVVDRAVVLTGSLDHLVSFVTVPGSDWLVFTNGINTVKYYDGTHCVDVPNLPSAGNTVCKSVALYNAALFLIGTTEGGVSYPQRVRRSDQTDPTNWTTGTSGFDNLLDSTDPVQCGVLLASYLIIYRQNSIVRCSFVGQSGLNYFYETMVPNTGVQSIASVCDTGNGHVLFSQDNVYSYNGDYTVRPIGDNLLYGIFGHNSPISPTYTNRSFIEFIKELQEIWIFYVSNLSSDNTCDTMIRYNITSHAWTMRKFKNNFVGIGLYTNQIVVIWSNLVGTWAQQNWTWNSQVNVANAPIVHLHSGILNQVYEYDYYSVLDNGSAIQYTVETKDFTLGDSKIRFDMIDMYIKGSNVTFQYSTDRGATWNVIANITQTTKARVQLYQQFVATTVRFMWTGTDSLFELEWFGFSYKIESIY